MFLGTGLGDYIITITTVATGNPALIVKTKVTLKACRPRDTPYANHRRQEFKAFSG